MSKEIDVIEKFSVSYRRLSGLISAADAGAIEGQWRRRLWINWLTLVESNSASFLIEGDPSAAPGLKADISSRPVHRPVGDYPSWPVPPKFEGWTRSNRRIERNAHNLAYSDIVAALRCAKLGRHRDVRAMVRAANPRVEAGAGASTGKSSTPYLVSRFGHHLGDPCRSDTVRIRPSRLRGRTSGWRRIRQHFCLSFELNACDSSF